MSSEPQGGSLHRSVSRLILSRLERHSFPLLVALCGWADTGKSTLAHRLCEDLRLLGVTGAPMSTDAFMKDRSERNALGITGYNPASIDIQALKSSIVRFSEGRPFAYHPYDNKTGTKREAPLVVEPCSVLVVEGIHSFHADVVARMHLKVFIDSDESNLRQMRYRANIRKRGMNAHDAGMRIQAEWNDYCAFLRPLSKLADLTVQVDQDYNYRCL